MEEINDSNDTIHDMKSIMKKKLCIICQFKSNLYNWCNKCKLRHFKLVYGKCPSENDSIDEILKNNYCEHKKFEELVEWIPYDRFYGVRHVLDEKFSKLYTAMWINGSIRDWDKEKFNWIRKSDDDIKVMLKFFENINDYKYHLKYNYSLSVEERNYRNIPQLYGVSKDPISLNYVLVFDDKYHSQKLCVKCQFLSNFFGWCENCKLDHFESTYGKNPSGNREIDEILKNNYCISKNSEELIEWIPYNEFKQISFVSNEESSKLYKAIRPKGYIHHLDYNKLDWIRIKDLDVSLKSFEDLNSLINHLKRSLSVNKRLDRNISHFYGISQDPTTKNFILVFDHY